MFGLDYFDDIAYDERFMPWQGWFNDFINGPKDQVIGYAVQQDKQEFIQFVSILKSELLYCGKILQLGLGCPGASHLCWKKVFNEVVSVDNNETHIKSFTDRVGYCPTLLWGDTTNLVTLNEVSKYMPFDAMFIDADHRYSSVRSDYTLYSRFVKSGGIIGFHDTIEKSYYGPENQAWKFVDELSKDLVVHSIGTSLGISWLKKE